MSRYVITGGAGFIGSNLAEAILANGDAVVILDNFATGKPENIAHITDRVTLIEGSVTDPDACACAAHNADYILHQAALASVPRSVADPVATNEANIVGTLNMLVAARDAHVKRFVYAASSSAYGDAPVPVKTEDLPPAPLSPYAIQKFTGELYCKAFHDLYGLQTIALRYFNVFGPRQDPKSQYAAVVPLFVTTILAGQSPTIYGDGEQARDFTYIENVVQANLCACAAPSAAAGHVFNTACGAQTSVNDLAKMIMETLDTSVPINYAPPRPGDVKNSLADISKAERLLGYEPTVPFREGLQRAIEWYSNKEK